MRPLGIIGLGLLGSAMAERLKLAGYELVGWDVAADRRDAFVQLGGRAAGSAAEVAAACDTILLSLPDSKIVEQVIAEIAPELRDGMLIVDTTTGDPDAVEAIGQKPAEQGVSYLDATVAGSSAQAKQGDVIIMVGGDAAAYEAAGDLFGALARQSFHVGPSGAGSRMKLVLNLVLGLNRAALAEGLTFAESLGLEPRRALEILQSSAAYSRVMDSKGEKMLSADFTPQARLSQHLKDVRLMLAAAARAGIELPLSELHRTLLERAEEAGYGAADNSAIIEAFRPPRSPGNAGAQRDA